MYNFLADLKFIYADIASKADLSITMVDPVSNEQFVIHAWIKDGWLYLQEGEKCTKVQIDFEEIFGTYENAKEQLNSEFSEVGETAIPSYIFSSVTKTETAEGTQYEFVISPKFISAVFRQAYGEAPLESSEYSIIINSARFSQVVVVKDEKVKKISFYMDVDLESSQYEHISGKVDYVINVNAMGKDVTISYPDFSGFVEEAAEEPVSES
jgi:hypothetical protein